MGFIGGGKNGLRLGDCQVLKLLDLVVLGADCGYGSDDGLH